MKIALGFGQRVRRNHSEARPEWTKTDAASLHFVIMVILMGLILAGCSTAPGDSNGQKRPVTAFAISEVTLLDGPFKHATELNKASLLRYEPDRLLAKFRIEAGLEPKAQPYGGWEGESLAGHSLGHHLSACALMYQTTRDERFLQRARYIVDELAACQQADGDGYLGAFPEGKRVFEEEVAKGEITAREFSLNGIWAPYYTHHKVMAGLRDAYRLLGISQALAIERRFADWIGTIVSGLSAAEIQQMLACEHGGINEVLVDLFVDTQDEKYLALSRVFHHKAVLDPLAAGQDILPGIHGNTQIPKLIGLARRYEVTGETAEIETAAFFWERVVKHHSYVTGGHGNHEYFGQPDQMRNRLSDETTETCNVYNMLKLSRHLFQWNPNAEVADFYERALFNHILAAQHPGDGRVIYNLSLEMGGHKHYENPEGFTCCVGSGMETHAKYGRNIFFKNNDELYVSQFIAAAVKWKERGVTLTQSTQYPEEQGTTLTLETDDPQEFTLHIRFPHWAEQGMTIAINGEPQTITVKSGNFVPLRREWASGDEVTVKIPFSLRQEPMPDDPNRAAMLYGPVVLAGDLGPEDDPAASDDDYVPVFFTESRDPNLLLQPVLGAANTFEVAANVARPRSFKLRPFYAVHERRYSVYWDFYNEERWRQYQADKLAEAERIRKLEQLTMDLFRPGEETSEKDHNFQGERTRSFDFRHRQARVADRGGWFSFDLTSNPDQQLALVVHYWGGFTGSKTFDILVDGSQVATENISGKQDGQFLDIQYALPAELTSGKRNITVRFQPHPGHRAGPIFGARTVLAEKESL